MCCQLFLEAFWQYIGYPKSGKTSGPERRTGTLYLSSSHPEQDLMLNKYLASWLFINNSKIYRLQICVVEKKRRSIICTQFKQHTFVFICLFSIISVMNVFKKFVDINISC